MILCNIEITSVGIAHTSVNGIQNMEILQAKFIKGSTSYSGAGETSTGEVTAAFITIGDRIVRVVPVTPRLYLLVCESGWFCR
jgi:hypothetical protein